MSLKATGLKGFTGQLKFKKKASNIIENPNVYAGSVNDNLVYKIDSSGNQVWTFNGHTDTIHGVAVDTEGNVYSGSFDNTVRKIDSSGNQLWSFTGHTGNVYSVAVDQNGNVYSASNDNTVRKIDSSGNQVWSYDSGSDSFYPGLATDPGLYPIFWT